MHQGQLNGAEDEKDDDWENDNGFDQGLGRFVLEESLEVSRGFHVVPLHGRMEASCLREAGHLRVPEIGAQTAQGKGVRESV